MKLFVVLLFSLYFSVNISAQAPRLSNISGIVKDEGGKVIAGASLERLTTF